MSLLELQKAGIQDVVDENIFKGGFPRLYTQGIDAVDFYQNYSQTYIEKDVRNITNVKNLLDFQKFMAMTASRVGQLLVYSTLANDLGISTQTVKEWLSILEASYLIHRLPPYFENFGKRIVKSPKLYFSDTGLAANLIDIETAAQMARDPLRGHFFENLVILELIKYRLNAGRTPRFYFFRDNHGNEVDVIYKTGDYLIPIEIKSSETFSEELLKGVKYFQSLVSKRSPRGYLVYAGENEYEIGNIRVINYKNIESIFEVDNYDE
jgi:hypothetical protein